MQYPLQLTFKLLAISPQVFVHDGAGRLVLYVKQQAFKLKEKVTVYGDEAQTRAICLIQADRVIDWSATYHITTPDGTTVGAIRRQGMRSMWKAHYDITDATGRAALTVREANPWIKVADGLLGQIPVVGMLTGYLFHPAYIVSDIGGAEVLRVTKQAALFEGRYAVTTATGGIAPELESLALPGLLMMLLLERARG